MISIDLSYEANISQRDGVSDVFAEKSTDIVAIFWGAVRGATDTGFLSSTRARLFTTAAVDGRPEVVIKMQPTNESSMWEAISGRRLRRSVAWIGRPDEDLGKVLYWRRRRRRRWMCLIPR